MPRRFIIALALICTACSPPHEQAAAPSASASTAPLPGIGTTGPQYFHDLLQRPDFARAFAVLSGIDQLPPWTRQGGTSTPAEQVALNGRQPWLVSGCKPHDCPSERLLVLYDEGTHAMTGVFARRKADVSADIDSNDPANDELIWLGAPDDAAKALLQQKLYLR